VFARYLAEFPMKEDFLFCSPLKATKSEGIINIVTNFMDENVFKWTTLEPVHAD